MSYRSGVVRSRLLAAGAALALVGALVAGCGSADGGDAPSVVIDDAPAADSPDDGPAEPAPDTEAEAPAEDPAEASYPVTVTADNGDVTIDAQPLSIASLSASATEMLYAIGAGDAVSVVDLWSDYPADLPEARVDAYQLNIEALTEFEPNLVVASYLSPDQLEKLATLGMPTILFEAPTDVDGMYAQITTLGAATGHGDGAAALVDELTAEFADISAQMPKHDEPYRYYYELDDTYYTITSDTFVGTLLASLGMQSIADDAPGAAAAAGYPQLSAEFILHADPDYILLADTLCCEVSAAGLAARDGWQTLSAVADDRVIELDDNIASRWSPRIVDLLRTVVKHVADQPVN